MPDQRNMVRVQTFRGDGPDAIETKFTNYGDPRSRQWLRNHLHHCLENSIPIQICPSLATSDMDGTYAPRD